MSAGRSPTLQDPTLRTEDAAAERAAERAEAVWVQDVLAPSQWHEDDDGVDATPRAVRPVPTRLKLRPPPPVDTAAGANPRRFSHRRSLSPPHPARL